MNTTKQKISILGCGWLGFPLAIHLVNKGYEVKGSTTSSQKLEAFHKYNIRPFLIEVNKTIRGANIPAFFQSDILILNIPPGRNRRDVATSHPLQVTAIAEKAVANGIQKVLFISSTSVYGNTNRVITEADEPQPETNSGQGLVAAEQILLSHTDFDTTILRMGGLVGLDRPAGRFLAGKTEVKNGSAPVNLVHQEDCIPIIREVIVQEKWGEIFNVCADEHPTKKNFYTHQAEKQGYELPHFSDEPTTEFKEISNYKIKKALNYGFRHPNPMDF